GSGESAMYGIAVSGGNAYVAGCTDSFDFPTVKPYQASLSSVWPTATLDCTITKLSSSGSALLYSTYLGGSEEDAAKGIAVESGRAFITGYSGSGDFPTKNSYQASPGDSGMVTSIVAELSSSGSALVYSTYLGGSWYDEAYGIAVASGRAAIVGSTESDDFPTRNPYQASLNAYGDAFITKLSSSGSALLSSTYLGGSDTDEARGIAIENGEIYVAGFTYSTDYPEVSPWTPARYGDSSCDATITKLSSSGSALVYSTRFGGQYEDAAYAIAVRNGAALITGRTDSDNFPTRNAYQGNMRGWESMFVSKLSLTGSLPLILDGGDYNGDGTADAGIFRSRSGFWGIRGVTTAYFGVLGDIPVSGDYNGDGTTDIGIFRPNGGLWSVRNVTSFYFGGSDDAPIPGDYSGDGRCEAGVFRFSSGLWSIKDVTRVFFGETGDQPVPGYFKNIWSSKDIAVFKPASGLWAIKDITRVYYGVAGDRLVPADYNGDGIWQQAIFRPSVGAWAIRGFSTIYFGGNLDVPVPADYDGNWINDVAIFRDSTGMWSVKGVSKAYYGVLDDSPVTR
ncbi:MAG: hypothetical protein NTV79_02585, partial [Candidatus Aureabacteria bacterium]|nr:hypothetical protein [Candidatus Auribacterota bacterium]